VSGPAAHGADGTGAAGGGGDLDAEYAAHGFSGRLGFGRAPAVVAVDIAMAYLDRDSPLYAGVEDAVASAARVIAAARAAAVPVLHTRVRYLPGGADGGIFRRKVPSLWVFDEGCPLGEPAPSVAPLPGEVVVVKQYASGFFGTSLASTLRAAGVDTVVVVGLTTSGCVRATALDAMQHGFVPIVVRDAVGDRDRRPHEANLLDLQAKYADVVTEAEAVAGLSRPRDGTNAAR
jgi:nicotinamidase-related amidase